MVTVTGTGLGRIGTPFSIGTDGAFKAASANIEIVGDGAKAREALACDGIRR